jgi:hypothetical protein
MMERLFRFLWERYYMFLVSGLLRGLVAATLLPNISEVRLVPEINTTELLVGRLNFARIKMKKILQPAFLEGNYRGKIYIRG